MSKVQLFRNFINDRLAEAALDIFGQYEKTITEWQEEISRARTENTLLASKLRETEIKLTSPIHQIDVQLQTAPEPQQIKEERESSSPEHPKIKEEPELSPQIKAEQELWTSQGPQQQPEVLPSDTTNSDTTNSNFTSPRRKTPRWDDLSLLLPLDQAPIEKDKDCSALPSDTIVVEMKGDSEEEGSEGSDPGSDWKPVSQHSDSSSEQSSEHEETGLLPELNEIYHKYHSTGTLESPNKLRKVSPRPCPSTRKTGPSSLARSIPSFSSGGHIENDSSQEAAEKPYQCEECGKRFKLKQNLNDHRRSHTALRELSVPMPRVFCCGQCGKNFSQSADLMTHQRNHIKEQNDALRELSVPMPRVFCCGQCGKNFSQSADLMAHQRNHIKEQLYRCGQCGKSFSQSGDLFNHQRRLCQPDHIEMQYHCVLCGKSFTQSADLIAHQRDHIGEQLYYCSQCGNSFLLGDLLKHKCPNL